MSKHILMVVTTADKMNDDHKTGLWLSEFGEAYLEFAKKGYEVTVASPLGGKAPVDDRSLQGDVPQEMLDTAIHLENTVKLDSISDVSGFDAVFLPGGHGTMFDLPDNEKLHAVIRELYEDNKIVAAVCHGPAGLVGVTLSDGTPLVAGKTVTAFTDEEERETTLDQFMPFLLETRLRELGANFVAAANWTDHLQVEGNLITGQNPQSTISIAKEVIKQLA
ncbi:type 1 glutamine amidotransferase domain-containing protein [Priestia flexa]|jgi:putative intracellular protease/amidase|uniref:type 1 glutamine amidotransferase domain-containing protein n=1 Tax=Priestia flexa TaxID=86664 RepID=UPI00099C8EB8|nr:type 1 glutamine amidotransferase domain-containing protein [Priestia flexa]AQX54399.1 glutamine amidotransferase [Priestia flexa]MBN8435405.1 type 1 glutamine amidotransferase domain-containing protein [Priestia flexa]MCA0968018.1 type 1 glutamine amidotransferase domain-containing protein [Priestia flexa]RIV04135.1 type 1 glutamine amidotransferase domain-containing protein [Priestia flexa]WEZ06602.1 type 1 glutamine amidotransferase domain-containing protein [Priestia flexa]